MLDTIQIFQPHALRNSSPPADWKFQEKYVHRPAAGHPPGSFTYDHFQNGTHLYGERSEIRYLRASLPRVLHGHNGYLIKSQNELDKSLRKFSEIVCDLADPIAVPGHFTRVDLAWHFRGDTADYIRAHRNCRHPRIRKEPVCHTSRSLTFRGSELQIKIYDKMLEANKRNGDIVRVEIQLSGRRLQNELGEGSRVQTFTFASCYQAYRRILLGFSRPAAIPKVSGIAELLAISERANWSFEGVSAFDIYTGALSQRQISRITQEMASLRPLYYQIDWAQLLPEKDPPPPIEILKD